MNRVNPLLFTLPGIAARCDEEGDCWLWRDATNHGGYPIFKPFGKPCTLVRRAAFVLAGGVLKRRQPLVSSCEDKLCVNPAHLLISTQSKIGQKAAKLGAYSSKARSAKIAAARRIGSKMTADLAQEIRQSTETGSVLALRYGVSKGLINGIKRGRFWKDYTGNPFSGLLR